MPLRNDRLRDLRIARGYTQEELAELLNLSIRQIIRYENGDNDPTAEVLAQMAKVLSISADYLLGLTHDPVGYFEEKDLSPTERKLITALRQGLLREALQTITELTKDEAR